MRVDARFVEALLPSLDDFPFSEERRLLYVAITRAKKKCYIVADPNSRSQFVEEIISPNYHINIASERFTEEYKKIFKCNSCSDGYYELLDGKHGKFYKCSSGYACRSQPRVCKECGSPSIDYRDKSICNNSSCHSEKEICDKCGRPMVVRESKFGKFLGCSGYSLKDDRCENTRRLM
ncbi:MAG: ATP-binding domain-containing protein [Colwellia sp.]|nr:ATP-binding domain-containing protein [Colwellia sp.]